MFSDSRFLGDAEVASVAAQAWREEIEPQHPRQSKKQLAKKHNICNTSGKADVSRSTKLSRHVDGNRLLAGKSPRRLKPVRIRIFSVREHGEQEAHRLAVEVRLTYEAMLDETLL